MKKIIGGIIVGIIGGLVAGIYLGIDHAAWVCEYKGVKEGWIDKEKLYEACKNRKAMRKARKEQKK